ncbi:MAG TPA: hypothetical protein GXX75_06900 [Clostridiales bacterium]|jgi:hypothetical protein|nr:hypothetical protein [Clostridiales bacterium]
MKLNIAKAKELVGKKIDCKVRRFGYYPMEIKERDGELYLKDAVGVCMPIPEREDDFNCHDYDFIID